MFVLFRLTLFALTVALPPASAWSRESLSGPVPADVVQVIDGDSVRVRARIWPGHVVTVIVRLLDIDAPELRGKCASERARARAARDFLNRELGGNPVELRDIRFGKYAGRVLARISTADGNDLSAVMLSSGNARPYAGRKRVGWCKQKTTGQP